MRTPETLERVRDLMREVAKVIRSCPTENSEKIATQYEHDAALLDWVLDEKDNKNEKNQD